MSLSSPYHYSPAHSPTAHSRSSPSSTNFSTSPNYPQVPLPLSEPKSILTKQKKAPSDSNLTQGAPKGAGVVDILTDSRFFLVRDTGEQDLELYADLARERSHQILAVFIRDAQLILQSTIRQGGKP
ncbi:hypothetical protein L208DRAFT_469779 [Tricholoma matsutake]|nr:hypothetical protein L208DRAFT_469779 [Tricholoma matsutake 945]